MVVFKEEFGRLPVDLFRKGRFCTIRKPPDVFYSSECLVVPDKSCTRISINVRVHVAASSGLVKRLTYCPAYPAAPVFLSAFLPVRQFLI